MTPEALAVSLALACGAEQDGALSKALAGLEPPRPCWESEVLAFWPRGEWARAACAVYAEGGWNPAARNAAGTRAERRTR